MCYLKSLALLLFAGVWLGPAAAKADSVSLFSGGTTVPVDSSTQSVPLMPLPVDSFDPRAFDSNQAYYYFPSLPAPSVDRYASPRTDITRTDLNVPWNRSNGAPH